MAGFVNKEDRRWLCDICGSKGRGKPYDCGNTACPFPSLSKSDPAITPAHYKTPSGLEAIDVIEAFGLGYRLGNVVKYVLRAGKKGEALRDLKKAAWYLGRQIEKMEQEAGGAKP